MDHLPALPDPAGGVVSLDDLPAVMAAVSTWLERAADVGQVEEVRAQLAALEDYVARRQPEHVGAIRAACRLAEVRLGTLLGQVRERERTDLALSPASDSGITKDDRHRFRLLARHADAVTAAGGVSRREALNIAAEQDEQRRQEARRRRQEVDRDARSIEPPEAVESIQGDGWTLLGGRATEVLAGWPDASVDLIVTDPPYPADALGLWSELGDLATRLLVPQGVLVALTGQILLPEVLARVTSSGLAWGWCYAQPLEGSNSRILARQVLQAWKPWLAFSRGPWPSGRIDWHEDVLAAGGYAKSRYRWEQPAAPAQYLIEHLAPRGGVVLDPFVGTGTYGVAALAAGRRFVGVEADAGRLAMAAQRLGDGAAA